MYKLDDVSIVITSLGSDDLKILLNNLYLNLDTNSNYEIIITIPKDIEIHFPLNNFKKLKIIKTYFYGQVNQRITGFKNVTKKYVLQIDDDVEISAMDILNLKKKIDLLGNKSAISPVFFDRKNKKNCIYNLSNSNLNLLFKNIITFLICKSKWGLKRSGSLTLLGTNYGVDNQIFTNKNLIEVDWLPGGCVMHYKKNLHKYDYFPFKGKAYCEDLIHSSILKKNNIKLFVCNDSICYTDVPFFPKIIDEKIKFLRAYNYYYFKFNKLTIRYIFWIIINTLRLIK